jgi:hypothetical protein
MEDYEIDLEEPSERQSNHSEEVPLTKEALKQERIGYINTI